MKKYYRKGIIDNYCENEKKRDKKSFSVYNRPQKPCYKNETIVCPPPPPTPVIEAKQHGTIGAVATLSVNLAQVQQIASLSLNNNALYQYINLLQTTGANGSLKFNRLRLMISIDPNMDTNVSPQMANISDATLEVGIYKLTEGGVVGTIDTYNNSERVAYAEKTFDKNYTFTEYIDVEFPDTTLPQPNEYILGIRYRQNGGTDSSIPLRIVNFQSSPPSSYNPFYYIVQSTTPLGDSISIDLAPIDPVNPFPLPEQLQKSSPIYYLFYYIP